LAQSTGASGDYASAIADLKWYQMFKLSEAEATAAQEKSWGFEAKQAKAVKDKELAAEQAARDRELAEAKARESSPEAVAAREQEQFLRRINGAQYRWVTAPSAYCSIEVRDGTIIYKHFSQDYLDKSWHDMGNYGRYGRITYELKGRSLQGFINGVADPTMTGIISEDGATITIHAGSYVEVFNRVR
jgi:hypothetical protein